MNTRRRARILGARMRDIRAAANLVSEALVVMDQDSRIRWFNPAAARCLALAWPIDRGIRLQDRLTDSPFGKWLDDGAAEAADLPSPFDQSVRLHAMLVPFGTQQRLLIARNIGHLARLEQVRRDFVANVSHELRTPLTVIHGYLELLDPEDVPALAPVLAEMRAQSQRMHRIVEDLLTLSRLEMQQPPDDDRVVMRSQLAALMREAQALSQGRHTIALEDEANADLLGSPEDLHGAFSNLVSNAVRYTPAGGTITLRWRRTADGGAEYAVCDTGYGIHEEHLERLTERFYRVSSSRSRGTGGTGLGLSIVKHVLNLHQARLRVESEPGTGSTFTCTFGPARILKPTAASS